jgi:hypothetical protein
MSWGAFSPTGVYAIVWRDRRNGLPNDTSNFEIYTSISLDGGISFNPNFCLSSVPSPFINQIRGNDFLGVCLNNNYLFAAWSDNRNNIPNKEDIYLRKESINLLTSISVLDSNGFICSIYPNPNSGEIFLKINLKSTVKMYNISGKEVLTLAAKTGLSKIKFNNANGAYFLKMENEKGVFTKKIIIVR